MGIIRFFDKLEDKVRFFLSKHPLVYGFIAGVGSVLFFRGVWMTTDEHFYMSGPITLLVSLFILLITGALVPHFLSEELIVSGRIKDKKIIEKTKHEIHEEASEIERMQKDIIEIKKALLSIKKSIEKPKTKTSKK